MSKGWYNKSYEHSLASRGIKTNQCNCSLNYDDVKQIKFMDVELYPDEITKDDILVMIDVDENIMKRINWSDEIIEEYKKFVKSLEGKTKYRIHGINNEVIFDGWNYKNWIIEHWANDYEEGHVTSDLIDRIKSMPNKGRIIIFGAIYDDCVKKVTVGLTKEFPNVYRWKNYSIGEAYDTYYYE